MYNSCLTSQSYYGLPEAQEVEDFIKNNNQYRYEHEHRKWEYGVALKFIREVKPKSILNVGGGNSPLSAMATNVVPYITEIDPTPAGWKHPEIVYIQDSFPSEGLKGKFDLVLCTSVIEHVIADWSFFRSLLSQASRYVFLTTDFHPKGRQMSPAHLRTYKESDLIDLAEIACDEFNFFPYRDVNYEYEKPMVYDYTFASLALWKNETVVEFVR